MEWSTYGKQIMKHSGNSLVDFLKFGVCHNIHENIKSCSLSSGIVDTFKFHILCILISNFL